MAEICLCEQQNIKNPVKTLVLGSLVPKCFLYIWMVPDPRGFTLASFLIVKTGEPGPDLLCPLAVRQLLAMMFDTVISSPNQL